MKLFTAAIFIFAGLNAQAQYYKTLPKGVRAGVIRSVQTSKIKANYNKSKSLSPIAYDIDINSNTIEDLEDQTLKSLFDFVKEVHPEGFEKMSAGSFRVSGEANLSINAYGLGYGISDKVTAYAFLPMYEADVKMKYQRKKQNNFDEIADLYTSETGNDIAQGLGSVFEAAPDLISGSTIQNMLTENYGYQEIGNWHGEGPGDLEFGIMYNFFEQDTYGLMFTLGGTAPTGAEDDPDILQDIAFGDGQWDAFVEFGGGYRLSDRIILNSFARLTHQFESEKTLRVPMDKNNSISERKGTFNEKLGDKILFDLDAEYLYSDWISFQAAYIYEAVGKASYNSEYRQANEYLAANTESYAHNIRLKAELSSVEPFMQKKFLLPAQVKFYYQTMIDGMNTPKVDRYEIEFRMFF